MQKENDPLNEEKVQQRKPYIKPQITSVNLIAEEAVLGTCKTNGCEIIGDPISAAGS